MFNNYRKINNNIDFILDHNKQADFHNKKKCRSKLIAMADLKEIYRFNDKTSLETLHVLLLIKVLYNQSHGLSSKTPMLNIGSNVSLLRISFNFSVITDYLTFGSNSTKQLIYRNLHWVYPFIFVPIYLVGIYVIRNGIKNVVTI